MKKLLCVLLAIMMVSIVGCTKSESAMEVYQKASENLNKTNSLTMDGNYQIKMSISGFSLDMPLEMHAEMDNMQDKATMVSHMNVSSTMFGTTTATETWTVDGKTYSDTDGTKSVSDSSDNNDALGAFKVDPKDLIKSIDMKKDGDNKVLDITIDDEKYDNIVKELLQSSGLQGVDFESSDINVTIEKMSCVVNKDYQFSNIAMTLKITGQESGMDIDADVDLSFDISNIDTTKVEIPDLSAWETTSVDPGTEFKGTTNNSCTCTSVTSEDDIKVTTDVTAYADDSDMIQSIKMTLTMDFPTEDAETLQLLKDTLDEELASEFTSEGTEFNSRIEDGSYTIDIMVNDMNSAAETLGFTNDLKNIDAFVSEMQAEGAVCK